MALMQHLIVLLVAECHQFGIGDQVKAVPVGNRHLDAGDYPEQDSENDHGDYLELMQEPMISDHSLPPSVAG
jgi:hypothetical protein